MNESEEERFHAELLREALGLRFPGYTLSSAMRHDAAVARAKALATELEFDAVLRMLDAIYPPTEERRA